MNVLLRTQNITSALRTVRKYFAIHLLMFSSAEKITNVSSSLQYQSPIILHSRVLFATK